MYCRHCGAQIENESVVCSNCSRTPLSGIYFCWYCGAQTNPIAQVCANCGASLQNQIFGQAVNKSRLTAGLFGIILGGFGVHNFYLGYTNKAIIQLVLGLSGFFLPFLFRGFGYYTGYGFPLWISAVWGLIEGIMILTGSINTDAHGNRLIES